ncbi:MAG TPA: 50S ribosomal protein L29 [Geobacterales bacterium]|nr:50S ribosomal protein L29 [Geobacterales bacterium]
MKLKELRKLSKEEREKRLAELRLELIRVRSQFVAGKPPKNVKQIRNIRKEIARILTLNREEELRKNEAEKGKSNSS